MITLKVTLPDQLAREAERAGLLSPESLEKLLRNQLKTRHVGELFSAMDRMAAIDDPPVMSPEEIARQVAMRAERRSKTCD